MKCMNWLLVVENRDRLVMFGDERTPDMVAASAEIAKRCHFRFQK